LRQRAPAAENGGAMQWLKQVRVNCLARAISGLDRLAALRGRADTAPVHLTVGLDGEDAAYFYLERQGYTVVARRWSAGNIPGDVDLIAWSGSGSTSGSGSLLCFIEVKTRSERDATPAEAAVDNHKRTTLRRLASSYVRQLPQETAPQVRFDVISVYLGSRQKKDGQKNDLVHFENAFGWSERRQDWD
jgi:putative endonuclease